MGSAIIEVGKNCLTPFTSQRKRTSAENIPPETLISIVLVWKDLSLEEGVAL